MKKIIFNLAFLLLCSAPPIYAQTDLANEQRRQEIKPTARPVNAVSVGLGTAVANADLPEAQFDLNMLIGYKRYISPNFSIGLTYNKFNVVFQDVYNEGFMSFDLNLEYLLFPDKEWSPFVFAGPGMNAANGFENSGFKFQVGGGLEYRISDNLGVMLMADRNFLTDDLLDDVEFGSGNDAYYRISVGTNIYISLHKKRVINDDPSFIKANPIEY